MGPTGYGTGQLDPVDDDIEAADGSEEIEVQKAEIAHTRTNMAETLDAIKDKLDPQAMMEQAREKVTTAASDVMDKAKATVHEVASDVVGQAKEVPQATVDAAKGAVSDAAHAVKDTFTNVSSVAGKAGGTVVDTVKANPIPYLLIGLGAGWLYWSSRQNSYRAPETRYITTQPTSYAEYDADATYGAGAGGTGTTGRVDRLKDNAGAAAGAVKDKVSGAADSVKGAVTGAASTVKDRAGQLAEQAQGTAQQLRSQVMSGVEQAQGTFQTTLETNPLAIGAVALGIGLGLGLLLPETNKEREVMGQARDRIGEKVQQTARELTEKAQTVAKESLDAAKEAAKEAVSAPA